MDYILSLAQNQPSGMIEDIVSLTGIMKEIEYNLEFNSDSLFCALYYHVKVYVEGNTLTINSNTLSMIMIRLAYYQRLCYDGRMRTDFVAAALGLEGTAEFSVSSKVLEIALKSDVDVGVEPCIFRFWSKQFLSWLFEKHDSGEIVIQQLVNDLQINQNVHPFYDARRAWLINQWQLTEGQEQDLYDCLYEYSEVETLRRLLVACYQIRRSDEHWIQCIKMILREVGVKRRSQLPSLYYAPGYFRPEPLEEDECNGFDCDCEYDAAAECLDYMGWYMPFAGRTLSSNWHDGKLDGLCYAYTESYSIHISDGTMVTVETKAETFRAVPHTHMLPFHGHQQLHLACAEVEKRPQSSCGSSVTSDSESDASSIATMRDSLIMIPGMTIKCPLIEEVLADGEFVVVRQTGEPVILNDGKP